MIFETHAHYDDAKFDTDREMLLAELPQRGISPVINAGSSIATTKTTLSLAQEYPFLYAAVGVHPSDVDDLNEDTYAWLRQQTTLQKTVAVGEIGLDYYWDKEPEVQQKQRYWFVRQLALAQEADYSFEGCCRGYDADHEKGSRRRNQGSDSLLFLFAGDGAGICKDGIPDRGRWRRDF